MATTLDVPTDATLSLGDYLEHVRAEVDVRDPESIQASAPALKALANDRSFLARALAAQMADWSAAQENNEFLAPSFILGRGKDLVVRANVWRPFEASDSARNAQRELLSYGNVHDHNYAFLTVGYFGSGYTTTSYRRDAHGITAVETTTLERGKVMFYRAREDIHAQAPPAAPSVSLNLLLLPIEACLADQHTFDLERQSVLRPIDRDVDGRCELVRVAAFLGDRSFVDPLVRLARTFPTPRVRAEAYAALARLEPAHHDSLTRMAQRDSDPRVRTFGPL